MINADSTKLMDLSEKLGLALGTDPNWKNGYVIYSIYSDEFDNYRNKFDDFEDFEMSLDLADGCWQITTGDCGVLNLPKEAPELMAEMSKLVK